MWLMAVTDLHWPRSLTWNHFLLSARCRLSVTCRAAQGRKSLGSCEANNRSSPMRSCSPRPVDWVWITNEPILFSNCFRCLICRKIRALALPTQLHPMWPLSPFFFWRLWILGSSRTLPYWRFLGGKLHRWADCRLNSLKSNMSCTSNCQKTQQPVNLCLFTAYLSALQPWCWGTNQTRSSQTWLRSFWFLPQQHRVSVTETQHLTPPQNK